MSDVQTVERAPIEALSFDLSSLHRVEFCMGMQQHERERAGLSCEMSTWPDEPRRLILRELAQWRERNPKAEPVALTSAITNNCVILIVHYRK